MVTGKRFSVLVLLLACLTLPIQSVFGACDQQAGQQVIRLLQKLDQQCQEKQFAAAIEQIEAFKAKHPDERHYLVDYHLGNLCAQAGRLDAALSAYDTAIAECENEPGLWRNRAKVAWELKQYTSAAESLTHAYELERDKDSALLFHAAIAYFHAGNKLASLDLLEPLIEIPGGEVAGEWLETYVNFCLEDKQIGRALTKMAHWRDRFEARAKYWRLRGLLHVHNRDYQQAAADLRIMAAFGPLQPGDKKLLADLLLQIALPLEAASLYEELLHDDPGNRDLHDLLITCYRLGLQPEQALAAIDRALKVEAEVDWLQSKGEILFEQGRFEQAFAAFSELLDRDPERGPAYLYRGYCAIRMEKPELARQALTRALRFKKEAKEARRLLSRLDQG